MKIKTNKINSANAQIEAEIPKSMIDENVENRKEVNKNCFCSRFS